MNDVGSRSHRTRRILVVVLVALACATAGGLVVGAACGALIGAVCGGAAPVELADVWSLARRPSVALRSWLDPRELVRLGAAVRQRTSHLFEGMFDPAPPPPTPDAKPPADPLPRSRSE